MQQGSPLPSHRIRYCLNAPNRDTICSINMDNLPLITEYVERCHNYEGFFTKSNVAALTEAAGLDERYEHGHVFD